MYPVIPVREKISRKALATTGFSLPMVLLGWLLLVGTALWSPSASADEVIVPLGTMTLSADTAVDGTYADLLTDPAILEDIAGEWDDTTTIDIFAPANYEFDTTSPITATPLATLDLGNGPGVPIDVLPTAGQVTFTVTGAHVAPSVVTFSGIRMRAANLAGAVPALVTIDIQVTTPGGGNTLAVPTPLVDVTVVPGLPAQLIPDAIASPQMTGVPFDFNMCIADQFGNIRPALVDTTIRAYVLDGIGGLTGDRNATILTGADCTTAGDINVAYNAIDTNVTLAAYVTVGDFLDPAITNTFDVEVNANDIDLVAIALTYDTVTEFATLSYAVDSPVVLSAYDIEFFLDRDDSGTFDFANDGPAIDTLAGDTNPGEYSINGDFSTEPPNADQVIFAVIDRAGAVTEGDPTNNTASVSSTALVDIQAVAVSYDSVTRIATLGYNVVTPTALPAYNIDFYLDRDLSGDLDTVLDAPAVASFVGQANPGSYTIDADYSADVPAADQLIFALIDDGNAVAEDEESNNTSSAMNTARLDLEAAALSYDSVTLTASFSYVVVAPTAIGAYDVDLYLDRDGSGDLDTVLDAPPITNAGDSNPGIHTLPVDLSGDVPAADQMIFAVLDPADAILEDDETNNASDTTNTAMVDIEAVSVTYDSVTLEATLGYNVISPTPLAAYTIAFFLDRDGSGTFDAVLDGPPVDLVAGDVNPGVHMVLGHFNLEPAAADQLIFTELDFGNAITEDEETNNNTSAMNTALVDLESVLLDYDSVTAAARFGYRVTSPTALAAYDIEFYLDRDNSGDLDLVLDAPPVVTDSGDVNPGTHVLTADLSGDPAAAGQRVFVIIDPVDVILEDDETNNAAQTQNTALTDIQAVSLVYDSVTRLATLGYTVTTPTTVGAYDIEFFLDRDGDDAFVFANDQPAVVTTVGNDSTGAYTFNADFSGEPPASGQRIFAVIDRVDAVVEANDSNNAVDAVNTAIIDIVMNSVALAADNTVAEVTVAYTVMAPTPVNPYTIRIGLDTNGDPATIETVLADQPGDTSAGAHNFTVDVRAALDAATVQDGFNIVAVADLNDDVAEDSDLNNAGDTPISVDLRLEGVALTNEFPFRAQVVYTILSPARVPAFNIRLGKDLLTNALITRTAAGAERDPGTHSIELNIANALLAAGVDTNENAAIAAQVDFAGTVTESDETNNVPAPAGTVSALYRVDLRMDQVLFAGTDVDVNFNVTVNYSIASNPPRENFLIRLYASDDDDLIVSAGDVLLRQLTITSAAEKTVGVHTRNVTNLLVSAADFNTGEFFLKAVIDPANTLIETAENNNARAVQNINPTGANVDRDGDGLTVRQEDAGFDLDGVWRADEAEPGRIAAKQTVTSDSFADSDDDGLNDALERATGTNPNDPDTDADGLADNIEDENRNGVVDAGETDPRLWDTDDDGLSDNEETLGYLITVYAAGGTSGRFTNATVTRVFSDPLQADTDADGISDWDEVNTWAREATAEAMESAGLLDIPARNLRPINKPVAGIRTDPSNADTDGDGIRDAADPAPQINPARWGYDMNGDDVFDSSDLAAIRAEAEAAGEDLTNFPTLITSFQRRLIDFDQDGDGFMEAPDANGDGFPDFTRYNEATLEQAFGIDFSNDGTLGDGFDVGGLEQGPEETPDPRAGSVSSGITRFGTFRVIRAESGEILGDGFIDAVDSIGQLIPTDNCPNTTNADQRDFDGDGLGDACDADMDNDGVPNNLDPTVQEPGSAQALPGLCGFGAFQSMLLTLLGLAGWRRLGGYAGRRG